VRRLLGSSVSIHAATSLEQLHRVLGLPLPQGISPEGAAASLGVLLAQAAPDPALPIGVLQLQRGADQDHMP